MFNRLFSDFCGCCSLFQAGYNPPFPPMCALMMSISISINVLSINVLSINVGINTHHSTNMAEHHKRSTLIAEAENRCHTFRLETGFLIAKAFKYPWHLSEYLSWCYSMQKEGDFEGCAKNKFERGRRWEEAIISWRVDLQANLCCFRHAHYTALWRWLAKRTKN